MELGLKELIVKLVMDWLTGCCSFSLGKSEDEHVFDMILCPWNVDMTLRAGLECIGLSFMFLHVPELPLNWNWKTLVPDCFITFWWLVPLYVVAFVLQDLILCMAIYDFSKRGLLWTRLLESCFNKVLSYVNFFFYPHFCFLWVDVLNGFYCKFLFTLIGVNFYGISSLWKRYKMELVTGPFFNITKFFL